MSQKTRIEGALTRGRWPTDTGFRHPTSAYARTTILRDAWLIDHDHREDEKEDGVEEEASDAACLTGRAGSL
jgi:hypothetical protein